MSSIINARSAELLAKRKFNPWGTPGTVIETPVFDGGTAVTGTVNRYISTQIGTVSTSVTNGNDNKWRWDMNTASWKRVDYLNVATIPMNMKTTLTTDDIQRIPFTADDEGDMVTLDMELGAKPILPEQMSGIFPTDGIGNIAVRMLPFQTSYNITGAVDAVVLDPKTRAQVNPVPWTVESGFLDVSRDSLGMGSNEYLTHMIFSIYMDSPNVGMWISFKTDSKIYYKTFSNVFNEQTAGMAMHDMEGETFTMPMFLQPDLTWSPRLEVNYRTMGKFVMQLRGIVYRRGI